MHVHTSSADTCTDDPKTSFFGGPITATNALQWQSDRPACVWSSAWLCSAQEHPQQRYSTSTTGQQ